MFRVGQEVECIEGVPSWGLVEGDKYTIACVGIFGQLLHVDIVEIKTKIPLGWRATRFRPIVQRKTSIEIFKRLLVPGTKILETV